MKVIFLDIDGVLNSVSHFERTHNFKWDMFDPVTVRYFNDIIEDTGASIVVSSSLRKGRSKKELKNLLRKNKVKGKIIGKTPVLHYSNRQYSVQRGCEIRDWLENHTEVTNYLILDDEDNMLYEQKDNFVQTTLQHGLTINQAKVAILILNKNE